MNERENKVQCEAPPFSLLYFSFHSLSLPVVYNCRSFHSPSTFYEFLVSIVLWPPLSSLSIALLVFCFYLHSLFLNFIFHALHNDFFYRTGINKHSVSSAPSGENAALVREGGPVPSCRYYNPCTKFRRQLHSLQDRYLAMFNAENLSVLITSEPV
jgi:hypothetical protein